MFERVCVYFTEITELRERERGRERARKGRREGGKKGKEDGGGRLTVIIPS